MIRLYCDKNKDDHLLYDSVGVPVREYDFAFYLCDVEGVYNDYSLRDGVLYETETGRVSKYSDQVTAAIVAHELKRQ